MIHRLTTPIREDEVRSLRIGDIVYISGTIITLRDLGHRRALEYLEGGRALPVDLRGLALYHAGPIARRVGERWLIISAGPTTSARMEAYEYELIQKAGIRLIIGKGGMGPRTVEACVKFGAAYAIYPGGAGALAARSIEEVEGVEWIDLGMPEAMWILKVRDFGPLLLTIDSHGGDLYADRRRIVEKNLDRAYGILKMP